METTQTRGKTTGRKKTKRINKKNTIPENKKTTNTLGRGTGTKRKHNPNTRKETKQI